MRWYEQPIVQAAARGVGGAVVAAGVVFFATLQNHGAYHDAWVNAGYFGFLYLALRTGVEGAIDQYRKP